MGLPGTVCDAVRAYPHQNDPDIVKGHCRLRDLCWIELTKRKLAKKVTMANSCTYVNLSDPNIKRKLRTGYSKFHKHVRDLHYYHNTLSYI